MKRQNLYLGCLVVLVWLAGGCTTSKKMVYLNNLRAPELDAAFVEGQYAFQAPIQKNDQLWITVGGSNLQDLAMLNSANGMAPAPGRSGTPQENVQGYLVESDGTIKLPFLGAVPVEGLTRLQLEGKLTGALSAYTKNPVVNVRFLNYKFSVLGEVQRPGVFTISNERITILEALSMAGDLTVMGKRESILILREVNGKREFKHISLLDKALLNSPYYYIKTNDVIYVEPAPSRFYARQPATQYFSMAAGALSIIISLTSLLLR